MLSHRVASIRACLSQVRYNADRNQYEQLFVCPRSCGRSLSFRHFCAQHSKEGRILFADDLARPSSCSLSSALSLMSEPEPRVLAEPEPVGFSSLEGEQQEPSVSYIRAVSVLNTTSSTSHATIHSEPKPTNQNAPKQHVTIKPANQIRPPQKWRFRLENVLRTKLWRAAKEDDSYKSVRDCLKAAIFLQITKDDNDISGALNLLEFCLAKGVGSEFNPPMFEYQLTEISFINMILFLFSSMKVESYEQSLQLLSRIVDVHAKFSRWKHIMADNFTLYALCLVVLNHEQRLEQKLSTREQNLTGGTTSFNGRKLLNVLVRSEIERRAKIEGLSLERMLVDRQGVYAAMRQNDQPVAQKINEWFPNLKLIIPEDRAKDQNYYCPLVSDLNAHEKVSNLTTMCFNSSEAAELSQQQRSLEKQGTLMLNPSALEAKEKSNETLFEHLQDRWRTSLRANFGMFIETLLEDDEALAALPFYTIVEPQEYVNLMMVTLRDLSHESSWGFSYTIFLNKIGFELKHRINELVFRKCGDEEKVFELYKNYLSVLSALGEHGYRLNHRKLWHHCSQQMYNENFCTKDLPFPSWSSYLYKWVAAPLVEIMLSCAVVYNDVDGALSLFQKRDLMALDQLSTMPAFKRTVASPQSGQCAVIGPIENLRSLLRQEGAEHQSVLYKVKQMPMLSPPVPRTSHTFGGNLNTAFVPLYRKGVSKGLSAQVTKTKLNSWDERKLYPVYDSMNVLSSVPWKINERVLDVMLQVFKDGTTIENLGMPLPTQLWPRRSNRSGVLNRTTGAQQTPIPPAPAFRRFGGGGGGGKEAKLRIANKVSSQTGSACETLRSSASASAERSESCTSQMKRELENEQKYIQLSSLKQSLHEKLTLAKWLRGRTMWFPYNMDFRGRLYPTATYLHHLGSDVDRGLLLFAKGRPLGPPQQLLGGDLMLDGLDWLKLHLANLEGRQKKKTLVERRDYINQSLKQVFASAEKPLECTWWQQFEDPWQALATCIEISNAVHSNNPSSYVCYLPVHQDGSCNGLQHYAALGRDEAGAREVNVMCSATPGDIYSRVAELVEQRRQKDAEKDPGAKHCEGLVDRSTVKRTVMTLVYGVTVYGANEQLTEALKDRGLPSEFAKSAGAYLANVVFESINELFCGARAIQDWLVQIADCVVNDFEQPMQWVTPLGLPVVQPYFTTGPKSDSSTKKKLLEATISNDVSGLLSKSDRVVLETGGEITKNNTSPEQSEYAKVISKKDIAEKPMAVKQRNAVAPNYIHSLDAAHLMLTALYCEREGLNLAAVHDSYWTHACDVNAMNKICREQFYKIHSSDLLGEFARYLYRLPMSEVSSEDAEHSKKARYLLHLLRNQQPTKGCTTGRPRGVTYCIGCSKSFTMQSAICTSQSYTQKKFVKTFAEMQ